MPICRKDKLLIGNEALFDFGLCFKLYFEYL